MFTGIAIELSTSCPRCKGALPLNGASESVLCDACRTVTPTPVELWRTVLASALGEAITMQPEEGRTSAMFTPHGKFDLLYGRLDARCTNKDCKAPFDPAQIASGLSAGSISCARCQTAVPLRAAPPWMREVHPNAAVLLGEAMAASAPSENPASVRFHCYHCGAGVPLDGKARTVRCEYCRQSLVVPDEIWVRVNPVRKVERWWVLLDIDVSRAAGAFPQSVSSLCAITVEAGGDLVLAWHSDDDGDAGHPCRIALARRDGLLTWLQSGVEFSEYCRLVTAPNDGSLWLVDKSEGFARQLHAQTGEPVRTLSPKKTAFDATEFDDVAIDWDGSFLLFRSDDVASYALRRFAPDGSRIPTWPGQKIVRDESDVDLPEWPSLRSKPVRLPSGARMLVGWDGAFWAYDSHGSHVAKFARDGSLLGVLALGSRVLRSIHGAFARRDGALIVLGDAAQPLGESHWPHIAVLGADGALRLTLGPNLGPDALSLGSHAEFLAGMPDGSFFVTGRDTDAVRGFDAEGRRVFTSSATRELEAGYLAETLAKARRGKRLAADRGR